MRPFLTLGITLVLVLAVVAFGAAGMQAIFILSLLVFIYLLLDARRSTKAIRANVSDAVARLDRALTRE